MEHITTTDDLLTPDLLDLLDAIDHWEDEVWVSWETFEGSYR